MEKIETAVRYQLTAVPMLATVNAICQELGRERMRHTSRPSSA